MITRAAAGGVRGRPLARLELFAAERGYLQAWGSHRCGGGLYRRCGSVT